MRAIVCLDFLEIIVKSSIVRRRIQTQTSVLYWIVRIPLRLAHVQEHVVFALPTKLEAYLLYLLEKEIYKYILKNHILIIIFSYLFYAHIK